MICRLDARVRVEGRNILVRRLDLQGSADFDPDPGTAPSCKLGEHDARAVELRLGAVHLLLPEPDREGAKPSVSGRIHAKIPASLAHRFVAMPHATGSLTLDLDTSFEGGELFPRVTGHVSGDTPGFDGKVFAKHIDFDLATSSSGTVSIEKLVAL